MPIDMDMFKEDVKRTIGSNLYPENVVICIFGLNGEIGELTDYLKKVLFHKHTLNYNILLDEMGDVLYYFIWLCVSYGIDINDIIRENIAKRQHRYPDGFDADRSINRQ